MICVISYFFSWLKIGIYRQLTVGVAAQSLHGMKILITQPCLVILSCDCNKLCGGISEQKISGTVGCRVEHLKLGAHPIKSLLQY